MPRSKSQSTAEFCFSKKTFAYFEGAQRNAADRAWFDKYRALYIDGVEVPSHHLVQVLRERLAPHLPGIDFSPRRISKPLLRRGADATSPALRHNSTAFFAEQATSMFEQNPGFYVSLGATEEDNVAGCGLYMPSARQMRELRPRLLQDAPQLRSLLAERTLRKHWDGLGGDKFRRFPKGFDERADGAEFLWHKRFFLGRHFTRAEVIEPSFASALAEAFAAAVPFVTWTRQAVGVYRKPANSDREN